MAQQVKDYLGVENARNKANADLFVELICRAYGKHCDVLIGHHLTFEEHGDIATENEIPAADTLLFDHTIMGAVFGAQAIPLMRRLAEVPAELREPIVRLALKVQG